MYYYFESKLSVNLKLSRIFLVNLNKIMALEVIKMKQGMSYSCKEKTIILNVFKYFRTIYPDKCVTEIVRRTAKATGCSEKSVFQFRKEEASAEGFKEPSKTKVRKNININSRFIKYDDSIRQGIRNIIYDLKYRNIVPSLSTILKNINADEKLPNFSIMTLRRLLRDMGFYYEKEKVGNKSVLVERTDIKKENVPCNIKRNQHNISSTPIQQPIQQPVQHSTVNNSNQKPIEKPFSLPQNSINLSQSQMYLPNHGHRPLPVPLPHHEHDIVNPIYISSGIMPHQIHTVPPNMKTDVGFMHPPHPHNMILQQ